MQHRRTKRPSSSPSTSSEGGHDRSISSARPSATLSRMYSLPSITPINEQQEEITIQHTLPMVGSYVTFELDVPATLDGLDAEQVLDPTLRAIAQQAPRRKYVGYVEQCLTSDLWSPWRAFRIRPLSQGLPYSNNGQCVTPDMCVPVYPTIYHPTSRRPLHPTKRLPWEDAYHHTCIPDIICRVRTAYAPASTASELPLTDQKRYELLRGFDTERQDKKRIRRRQSIASTFYVESMQHGDLEKLLADAEATNFEGFGLEEDDDESLYSEDEEDSQGFCHVKPRDRGSEWVYGDYRTDGQKMQTLPAVEVSYDVWSVSHIHDSSMLLEDLHSLVRLVDKAKSAAADAPPSPSTAVMSDKDETRLLQPQKGRRLRKIQRDEHTSGCLPTSISHSRILRYLRRRVRRVSSSFNNGLQNLRGHSAPARPSHTRAS